MCNPSKKFPYVFPKCQENQKSRRAFRLSFLAMLSEALSMLVSMLVVTGITYTMSQTEALTVVVGVSCFIHSLVSVALHQIVLDLFTIFKSPVEEDGTSVEQDVQTDTSLRDVPTETTMPVSGMSSNEQFGGGSTNLRSRQDVKLCITPTGECYHYDIILGRTDLPNNIPKMHIQKQKMHIQNAYTKGSWTAFWEIRDLIECICKKYVESTSLAKGVPSSNGFLVKFHMKHSCF